MYSRDLGPSSSSGSDDQISRHPLELFPSRDRAFFHRDSPSRATPFNLKDVDSRLTRTPSQAGHRETQQTLRHRLPRPPAGHDTYNALRYQEGVEEGRRLQAQQDRTRMYRYRQERDVARDKVCRYEDELRALRAQLFELEDAMVAMRLAYEEHLSGMLAAASSTRLQGQGVHGADSSGPRRSSSVYRNSGFPEAGLESDSTGSTGLSDFSADEHSPDEDQEEHSGSSSDESGSSGSSSLGDRLQNDAALQEVQALIARARDEKIPEAVEEVKALCTTAHNTPRHARTPIQKYLLKAWGPANKLKGSTTKRAVPTPNSSSAQRRAGRIPRLASVPEMIVDASGSGIGFLLNSRWRAWTLRKGWKADGRDILWAELVAVELGLRTCIAMGVRATHLRVRSDNMGVIAALNTKAVRGAHDAEILDHILALCERNEITMMPLWIWTKANPADPISRQRYPSSELMVVEESEIPAHLLPFVGPISSEISSGAQ